MAGEEAPLDALVLGAGAAGLACAERLRSAGLRFRVLEASGRIGGRADTDYGLVPGRPVELGAMMVHGRRSVTHAWAAELGLSMRALPVVPRARFSLGRRPLPYRTLWVPFRRPFGLRPYWSGTRALPRAMQKYRGPDRPLARFLDERHASPGARALVDDLHAHVYAADPDQIGVRGPMEEEARAAEGFGFANFQLLEGYDELFRRRAAGFREAIRFLERAVEVRWRGGEVRIRTVSGEDGRETIWRASRAVVTVPAAVLRAEAIAFDPPLPPEKRAALQSIATGDALKVAWRLRGSDLLDRLGDFSMIWADGASTFHRPFVGIGESGPLTLTVFTTGREARRRAQAGAREATDAGLRELEEALPRGTRIGEPTEARARLWPTDPLARGGYTYLPPGASVRDREDLARALDGRLFFAGEATHTRGESGTVHGAIETGYRAAEELRTSALADREHGR